MASSAPPPSSSSPPLHLLTPKPEPPDPISDLSQIATPNTNPDSQQFLVPHNCSSSSNEIEDPIISEYLRLAQLYSSFMSPGAKDHNALALVDPSEEPKKKKARGNGLVRVSNLSPADQIQNRVKIRQVRMAYDSLRCFYVLQNLINPNLVNVNLLGVKPRLRADLKASLKMREKGLFVYNDPGQRIVGSVPGVNIGDVFFYRAELMVLGLHNQIQGGIGFAPAKMVPEGEPIATSVVASGGYQDDLELGDDIIMYTGSGGRLKNQPHVSSDQSLERGNLALERSMNYGVEVRVVRGVTLQQYPLFRVYVYDGLYRVVECQHNRGKSGCHVYLFKLVRIKGQEESGTLSIRLAREIKAKLAEQTIPAGYICADISGGIETVPVPFFNDIDKEEYPLEFDYVKTPDYPLPPVIKALKACRCREQCQVGCECMRRNNFEPAYDSTGILLRGRPIVYECGDTCSCPTSCPNRVTQKGMKLQLEVFRSKDNIWGVRSLDVIQAGSFICEFSGDVVLREEMGPGGDQNQNQNQVLIDPQSFFQRWREWGDVSEVFSDAEPKKDPLLQHKPAYLLDVSRRRNVACYISHSSSPNVFVQFVLHAHDDVNYPRMMIFAMENIPPLRELSLDYGAMS
ncbi:hypothetical protein LUZ61_018575 [Rhynchospora tenuis]|uniref:Uncharacterized protein n=1 Tax=Rhynchospora tenuis TaxID=198213 RepID=A0AAD5Z9P5_9POAL|nr:hypothetical protein LUZ61_018575 [Rhynchospora tenuis]